MLLNRHTPTQMIEIKQPRWHDRTVLIARYKVGTHNKLVFTDAPTFPGDYYLSGDSIKRCPIQSNGTIQCYVVPLDELEPLEIEAPRETVPEAWS